MSEIEGPAGARVGGALNISSVASLRHLAYIMTYNPPKSPGKFVSLTSVSLMTKARLRNLPKVTWLKPAELGPRFSNTCTKIGARQRLAWPLCKDNTQTGELFHCLNK